MKNKTFENEVSKELAIQFANWLREMTDPIGENLWEYQCDGWTYTTEEMYNIYYKTIELPF